MTQKQNAPWLPWQILPVGCFILGLILIGLGCIANPASRFNIPAQWTEGRVLTVDAAQNKLQLQVNKPPTETNMEIITYSVSPAAGTPLSNLAPDDMVWFEGDKDGKDSKDNNIKQLIVNRVKIGCMQVVGAILLSFSVIWAAILLVTGSHPWAFALGIDLRLSNSQTQIFLWFLVLATVYLAELSLRFAYTHYFGGISVPARLLALAGVSALTFGGARANTAAKVALAHASAAAPLTLWAAGTHAATKPPPLDRRRLDRRRLEHFLDLFRNDDGKMDFGDFQMIALTVITIGVYLVISVYFLTDLPFQGRVNLPPVDDTLLGGTAISQGAYLAKKIGSGLGN